MWVWSGDLPGLQRAIFLPVSYIEERKQASSGMCTQPWCRTTDLIMKTLSSWPHSPKGPILTFTKIVSKIGGSYKLVLPTWSMLAVNPIQSDCLPESMPSSPLQVHCRKAIWLTSSSTPGHRLWFTPYSLSFSIYWKIVQQRWYLHLELVAVWKEPLTVHVGTECLPFLTEVVGPSPPIIARVKFVGRNEGWEFRHFNS